MLRLIITFFKDRLFPVFCLGCGIEGVWCCEACETTLRPAKQQNSPTHNQPSALTGVSSLLEFRDGELVAKLIHSYKYQHIRELESLWQRITQKSISSGWLNSTYGLLSSAEERLGRGLDISSITIIAVPLHPRRQRERGFNQAFRLAEIIAAELRLFTGHPYPLLQSGLTRNIYTKQQARLDKIARQSNLQEAFTWSASTPPPSHVLLVDDVYTTGATLESAAQALIAAGTKQVWGITLARAVF